jgi:hypothetical protein
MEDQFDQKSRKIRVILNFLQYQGETHAHWRALRNAGE